MKLEYLPLFWHYVPETLQHCDTLRVTGMTIVSRHADVVVITGDDDDCTVMFTRDSLNIGKKPFAFPITLSVLGEVQVASKGNITLEYYNMKVHNERSALLSLSAINMENDVSIAGGMSGINSTSAPCTTDVTYNYKSRDTDEVSCYVFDHNVMKLQNHEDMNEYAQWWDRNMVRLSNPPCIVVRLLGNEKQRFEDFVHSVLPSACIRGYRACREEVPQTPEEKEQQIVANLAMHEAAIASLFYKGVLSY